MKASSIDEVDPQPAPDTSAMTIRSKDTMHKMGRNTTGDSPVTQIFTLSRAYRQWVQPRVSHFEPLFITLYGAVGSATRHTIRIQVPKSNNAETRLWERNRVAGEFQLLSFRATERANRNNNNINTGGQSTSNLAKGDIEMGARDSGNILNPAAPVYGDHTVEQNGEPGESSNLPTDTIAADAPYNGEYQTFQNADTYYNPGVVAMPFAQYQQMMPERVAAYANPTHYWYGQQWHWVPEAPQYYQQEQAFTAEGPSVASAPTAPMAMMPSQPQAAAPSRVNRHGRRRQRGLRAVEIRAPPAATLVVRPPPAVLSDAEKANTAQHQPVVSYPQADVNGATHTPSQFFMAPN